MEMRRRGREVGHENIATNAFLQQKKDVNKGKQSRKLIILPAKPPPRKSHSVMSNNAEQK